MGACTSLEDQIGGSDEKSIHKDYHKSRNHRKSDYDDDEDQRDSSIASRSESQGHFMSKEQDSDLNEEEITALRKIQKSVRRTKALGKALTDNHWHFFAQVDTLEENEVMHMATFLNNLIQLVPGVKEMDEEVTRATDTSSGARNAEEILLEELVVDDSETHIGTNIKVQEMSGGSILFSFKGSMNPAKAQETIAIMRGDEPGRMNSDSMRKLLRAVYRSLKTVPNISEIHVPENGKLVVVGDIHGQLSDLLNILDDGGMPSETNFYLFNGDFVDRGANSVEVITVLFSLFCAYPGCVFFNRGNHEDTFVCQNYGFQEEVVRKYDLETFFMFGETFKHLPLFSVIDDTIFVVHGGLFTDENATLKELNEIDRVNYMAVPPVKFPANTHGKSEQIYKEELLKQFQRDALWSDPCRQKGTEPNHRGAGVMFGPDVTNKFFENNNLKMVIRSHEMCQFGIDFPYHSSHHILDEYLSTTATDEANNTRITLMLKNIPLDGKDPLLCTLFSASNYCGGDNEGAYMVIRKKKDKNFKTPAYANEIPDSLLHFTVHRYRQVVEEGSGLVKHSTTAMDLLIRKKRALTMAFRDADLAEASNKNRSGGHQSKDVSLETWSTIMTRVTGLKIRWIGLVKSIVPDDALKDGRIEYMKFLENLHKHSPSYMKKRANSHNESQDFKTQSIVMDTLYGNTKRVIEKIFFYFDANKDGEISPEEFRIACHTLNEGLAEDDPRTLLDIDHMLETMDFNHSGNIDINEFFECFRLLSRYKQTHPDALETPARRKSKRGSSRPKQRLSADEKLLLDGVVPPPAPHEE